MLRDDMMVFTVWSEKFTATQGAIVGGSGTAFIILTLKPTACRTASPFTDVIFFVVGVKASLALYTIVRSIKKGRKRRQAVKMIIGFEEANLMGCVGSFEN